MVQVQGGCLGRGISAGLTLIQCGFRQLREKKRGEEEEAEGKSILFSVEVDTSIEFSSYMGLTWMHKLSTKIKIQPRFESL